MTRYSRTFSGSLASWRTLAPFAVLFLLLMLFAVGGILVIAYEAGRSTSTLRMRSGNFSPPSKPTLDPMFGRQARRRPDVMTLDLTMPGIGGLQFLRDIHGKRHPPIIVVSSASTATAQALEAGAAAFFDKTNLLADMPQFMRKLKKIAQATTSGTRSGPRRGRADNGLSTLEI